LLLLQVLFQVVGLGFKLIDVFSRVAQRFLQAIGCINGSLRWATPLCSASSFTFCEISRVDLK
jgi:hypothetical protein